jgi:hypothetical protein
MKTDKLKKLNACSEAIQWAEQQDNEQQAWDDCHRGDWMLWLCGKLSGEPESEGRKLLVLAACECARLSIMYVAEGEERPLNALEIVESWAKNEGTTIEEVRAAASAAADAAYAAYAAAAAAAYAAYAAAARNDTLRQCADIVRRHYPSPPLPEDEPCDD